MILDIGALPSVEGVHVLYETTKASTTSTVVGILILCIGLLNLSVFIYLLASKSKQAFWMIVFNLCFGVLNVCNGLHWLTKTEHYVYATIDDSAKWTDVNRYYELSSVNGTLYELTLTEPSD